MPSRDQVAYFGAGPASLPTPVLEEASKVLLNYNDSGISLAELSHRSPEAKEILDGTKSALRQLLDIPQSDGPDGYEILFLQGGGSGEFSATIYHFVSLWVAKQFKQLKETKGLGEDAAVEELKNLVQRKMKLDYFVTGSWSIKANQEAARLLGAENVNTVTDGRRDGKNFGSIPSKDTWKHTQNEEDCVMTYYCDNETVDGVEFHERPAGYNLVSDMSSNFLSRPVDVRKYAAIFAGAQKNVGTTGITVGIISNKMLPPHAEMADPKLLRKLGLPIGPVVLDWPTISKNSSLYNTLSIFDVWIAGRVMERLLAQYPASKDVPRLAGQEAESNKKSEMLYSTLDKHSELYQVVPDKDVRSRMNICFRIKSGDAETEKAFVKGAESRGLLGIKGHRSVGGMRVSCYNAVPVKSVEILVEYLNYFAKQEGSMNGHL